MRDFFHIHVCYVIQFRIRQFPDKLEIVRGEGRRSWIEIAIIITEITNEIRVE